MGADRVRQCTEAEALDILKSKGVRNRLDVEPDAIRRGNTYLVNGRLLLSEFDHGEGNCEAHISSCRDNWRFIHQDIDEALKFLVTKGYNTVYTMVNERFKTAQNLITKHGFADIDLIGDERIFKWELKRQY